MTRDEIRQGIQSALSDITDHPASLKDNAPPDEIEGWDSVNHIKLIVALENEWGLNFEVGELALPETVGQLIDLIQSKF